MKKTVSKDGTEFYQGSGNIYADLGLSDADEHFARASLAIQIIKILNGRGIKKQIARAEILGISKTEMSELMNGNFKRFSESRLISFLNKLDYKVTMQIAPMQKGDRPQDVVMM